MIWPNRAAWVALLCAATAMIFAPRAEAAASRAELMFALNVALKTNDRAAVERCFNFEGLDELSRESLSATIEQICDWRGHHVFTTERKDRGPLEVTRDGRRYTLNGTWTFQIHIHKGKLPSKGFVFPAGSTPSGGVAVLAIVPG